MPGLLTWPLTQNSFGPPFFSGPERREPFRAVQEDRRQVAERFDVVDRGRAVVEAGDGRERRLDARLRALAFERLDQRRLFARFVGAGAAVNDDVAVEAGAHDVLADVALRVGLGELGLHHLLHVVELAADVDVGDLRADRPAADQAALEQQVRVALHQHVILERAGLALVGVAGDVLRQRRVLEDELPLHAGRESGAAAAAQARGLDHVDDGARLHAERLAQPVVALVLQEEVEGEAVGLADVLCENWFH